MLFSCCSAPLPSAGVEGIVEVGAVARAKSDGDLPADKATVETRSLSKKCLATEQPEDDSPKRHKSKELSKAAGHVGLRVRTAAGNVVLSVPAEECAGMPVRQLRERLRELVGRSSELKLFLGTRELIDSESLDDPGATGVQEVLLVTSEVPTLDPDRPVLEQLDVLKDMIMSGSPDGQLDGCTHVRKLLSVELNPPIQAFVELGVVPRLLQLGEGMEGATPQIQFEALWAVTNIASGTTEQTQVVVGNGALQTVARILGGAPEDNVWEQAVWLVGNIAGDSCHFRDLAIEAGAMQPILGKLEGDHAAATKISLVRQGAWALSNLCRGKPSPPFEAVAPALPVLAGLLLLEDEEVKTDAAWAVSYISDGNDERIGAVIGAGILPHLLELLRGGRLTRSPALRAVGNLCTGGDVHTQAVLDAGGVPALVELLHDDRRVTRKEACWSLSNILAGTRDQIGAVLDAGVLPRLLELLSSPEEQLDVKREAAWCIANASSGGSPDHIRQLVTAGCIEAMPELMGEMADTRTRRVVLEFLETMSKVKDPSVETDEDVEGLYESRVRDALARDALQVLVEDEDDTSEIALRIMERLYRNPEEEEEEEEE